MNAPRPLYVEMPLRINAYDIDVVGIVSNIVYVRWLEDLRMKILDEYFPLDVQLRRGIAPVLAETTIRYRRPLTIFDHPVGRIWLAERGRARWTLEAEIALGEDTAARARQSGYFIDVASRRPIPLPKELRDHLP